VNHPESTFEVENHYILSFHKLIANHHHFKMLQLSWMVSNTSTLEEYGEGQIDCTITDRMIFIFLVMEKVKLIVPLQIG
jgi:hypothetical protein